MGIYDLGSLARAACWALRSTCLQPRCSRGLVGVCASHCFIRAVFQQLLKQEEQSPAVSVTLYSAGLDTNLRLQHFPVICVCVPGVPAVAGGVGVLGIYDFKVVKESTWDKCLPVCFRSLQF